MWHCANHITESRSLTENFPGWKVHHQQQQQRQYVKQNSALPSSANAVAFCLHCCNGVAATGNLKGCNGDNHLSSASAQHATSGSGVVCDSCRQLQPCLPKITDERRRVIEIREQKKKEKKTTLDGCRYANEDDMLFSYGAE